jgi:acid phosphatase (class A)
MLTKISIPMKLKSRIFTLAIFVALITGACVQQPALKEKPLTSLSKEIKEIRPGILEGYLGQDEYPNSLSLLPPPPEEGSAAYALDQEKAAYYVALTDEARKEQAIRDNELAFPEAAEAFDILPGVEVSEEITPHLYMILRRSLADAGLSTYGAKDHYQRTRPFVVNQTPTLIPDEEEYLSKDGSYPSGHTAIGWAWALILAEVYPGQADAILKRGKEFGISRNVCNVHWHSDVLSGRIMGAAAVARLHANADFLIDLEAAKEEVAELSMAVN